MRRVSCLRAEALRLCGALQEASCEGAEAAWAELLAAAAARAPLDRLLRLHLRALERHSVHAMIHHSTQVRRSIHSRRPVLHTLQTKLRTHRLSSTMGGFMP